MQRIAVALATLDSRQILKPRQVNMHPFYLLHKSPLPFAISPIFWMKFLKFLVGLARS
jgi:hypothetical protein